MQATPEPFIPSEKKLPEITLRVVILSVFLAAILAMSNAYLALKVGVLVSASIPAAIISMSVLRFFKRSNILENNLVQTAASAGEAVAGGIVYTIPALILIHFWTDFPYWQNVCIALAGGMLGVLFSIPLRRVLVTEKTLTFPEGRAIAEVLIVGSDKNVGFREILLGGVLGAVIEFFQTGLKLVADNIQLWFSSGRVLFGFGGGFSVAMIGVGYLIGIRLGLSLVVGAAVGWFFGVPLFSLISPADHTGGTTTQWVMALWEGHIRYVGIGAMLVAGIWTLADLVKPFFINLKASLSTLRQPQGFSILPRVERDLPFPLIVTGIIMMLIALWFLFAREFPLDSLALGKGVDYFVLSMSIFYVIVVGFILSAICGYFSGMVGVTASPGSAVIIAGLLLAALLFRGVLNWQDLAASHVHELSAAAMTIFLGAVIQGAAAIANDNIQDLKVGHIVGATPWKQQLMLMLGVTVSAFVIPWVMQLLFNVYGIGDVLPHAGMDPTEALLAPPAAMMAAVTEGVFNDNLPWNMIFLGAGVVFLTAMLNRYVLPKRYHLSLLGVSMGIYLPLATSMPLFLGGCVAWFTQQRLERRKLSVAQMNNRKQGGMMLACGLVSGAAVMNIVLAIPFMLAQNPDVFDVLPAGWQGFADVMGIVVTAILLWIMYRVVCGDRYYDA